MVWKREDIIWLAGLFEGEGTIASFGSKKNDGWRLNLSIKMTDLDVLERVQRITGCGKVYGPYQSSYPGAKQHFHWNVSRSAEAYALLIAMWPWLGQRRRARILEAVPPWLARASYRSARRLGRERGADGRYLAGLRS